jgi:MFS family permease
MAGVAAGARGRAAGFINGAIGLAFAVGPLVAGDLVARFGWRAVFLARLPVALLVLGWALALPSARVRLGQPTVRAADVLCWPVIGPGALAFLAYGGMFSVWLLTPFDLVERRGFDARTGGLLFMLTPLGIALGAPLSGRLTDRVGPRGPVLAGLVLETLGLAALGAAGPATPILLVAAALLAVGLGVGIFQVPNMAVLMAQFAPAHQGAGGGFVFLARTLGIVAGVAAFGLVFRWRRAEAGLDGAFSTVFGVAAVLVALAVVVAGHGILAAVCRRPTGGSSSRSR